MKTLAVVAALAIVLMFAVTACNDQTRYNCNEQPTAERCPT